MSQIGLPFDWGASGGGGGALLHGEANALAVRLVEGWREWPVPVAVVSGPPRSGKSLLGREFRRFSGGHLIDDAQGMADEALFHAWNRALDTGVPLLMLAREGPERWTVSLPDLRSRLAAVPHVRIAEPDHELVRSLVEQGLAAAGTAFAPDAPEWIARRVERSYANVAAIIARLNHASLSSNRKISVSFAKETLQAAGFLAIVFGDPPLAPRGAEEE